MFTLIAIGWLACGLLGYGVAKHDFITEFPTLWWEDRKLFNTTFLTLALLGPLNLVIVAVVQLIEKGPMGLRFRDQTYIEYYNAHVAAYPSLEPAPPTWHGWSKRPYRIWK